ncbi:unnamed protein product, partial [Acanthoscelides obtectus]
GIAPRIFYGKAANIPHIVAVLPPDDPCVSDVGKSSDEEELFGGDYSDLDPDYQQPPTSKKRKCLPVVDTSSDCESEDDLPLANFVQTSRDNAIPGGDKRYTWSKTDFQHIRYPKDVFFVGVDGEYSPLAYFEKFFDDDLFEHIAHQTNIHSTLTTGRSIDTTANKIRSFVGIELIMGVVQMPAIEDYWSIETRYSIIADVMPVKRFKKLGRRIHFQDNNTDPQGDRLFKIRPFIEKLRQKCIAIEEEGLFSIDEMMIAYKGKKAGSLRQYMPKKPKKWGFKMFVRAGVSGIVQDFLIYTGSSSFDEILFSKEEQQMRLGAKVKNKKLASLGTIRSNRLRGCPLLSDKELLRKGRGSFDYRVENSVGLAVIKWADTKCVTLASSYISHSPVFEVSRFSKEQKKKVNVQCPQIVKQYNIHMGGVNLSDTLLSLYKTPFKSKRWYLAMFSQMIDIAVNNAWLLYRRDLASQGKKYNKLKDFRINIAKSLIQSRNVPRKRTSAAANLLPQNKIKVPVAPRPTEDVRCFNCQALGHTAGNCQKEKICPCGNPPHEGPCPEPKKCVNCEGPHSAAYMNCPKLKAEAAIQKVKVMENITYAEAKRKVNITTPKPTTSYSAAVQKSSEMNIQQIISTIIPHIETAVRNVISCSTSKCDHFKAPSSGLIFRRDRSDSVSTNLSAASEKRKKPGDSTTDDDSSALDPNSNPTKKRGRPKRTAP